MIIRLNDEVKQSIIDYIFENKNAIINRSYPPFNMTEFIFQFDYALRYLNEGYGLNDLNEQSPEFNIYNLAQKLDIGSLEGFGPGGEYHIFGIVYDFNNFSEDIDTVYCIDSDGSDHILHLKR